MNKLFWLCQGSEHPWSSDMFDRFLIMSWVLNKPGFWIWQGLCRVPNMSDYDSLHLNNAWIWLNMPYCPSICLKMAEYCWNVPEYACRNCSDYARIHSMLQYSYNNIIIIVTNVIILEFLSTWFENPGTLLTFYLF